MAQTKCLFLTGSFILLLAAGLSHSQTTPSSTSTSPSSLRSYGYFNQTSLVTLTSSTWDLRSVKEVTLRTCHPEGTLLVQRATSSSSVSHLALVLRNGSVQFQWTVASYNTSSQNMSISSGLSLTDNQQYTVRLRYYLGTVYLSVTLLNQAVYSTVVANATYNHQLLAVAMVGDLHVGDGFTGCLWAGPGVDFRDQQVLAQNVTWNTCPLQTTPACSFTDGNDCYRKPCQNGGTCIDMFQDYLCVCPRNFNGTNCENDLAREYGCAVGPCENNSTCVAVTGASAGVLPYHCTCRAGFTGVNCETLLNQCEMTPNPCQHGVCTSTVNSYTCNCNGTGFQGKNCSEDINECSAGSPCGTGQCFNIPGTFSCQCPAGFDGPMCQDIDECKSSPCQNGATCVQGVNNYTCTCAPGFQGGDCQTNINDCAGVTCPGNFTHCVDAVLTYRCACLDGYVNITGVCVEVNECESNPCRNNATCQNMINAYNCTCRPGFEGKNCEVNINDCLSRPCLNNATCVDGVNNFTCQCVPGFTGLTCGTNINDCIKHQCSNGATCQDQVNGYRCVCAEGWTGERCTQNIDDCASSPCQNNATCRDGVAFFSCVCQPGFTDSRCGTNINDCSPNPCQNNAPCVDGINDYSCTCGSDWMGKNCSKQYDACSFRPCQNNATCLTTIPQHQYRCQCVQGFNGTNCEHNIDDCVGRTCLSYQRCYDGINNYTCACPIGFTGAECSVEIDECEFEPCQNNGVCHNQIGFYNCSCPSWSYNTQNYPTGYTGVNCEVDINECAYNPPICQNGGSCTNKNGSYECLCLGQTPTGALVTGMNCDILTSYCLVSGVNPCQNGATCRNSFGTYSCECVPGYTDKNCSTNINECASSPCQYSGTCQDLVNGYLCSCIPGITGPNCQTNIDDCQSNPCGPGLCNDLINNYECNCTNTGFKGRNCEINIDDCLPGICQHNGSCQDGINTYTCKCQLGYTGVNCKTDIAECASSPCQYNGTCLEFSNQALYGQGRPQFAHFSYTNASGYFCDCIAGIEGVNCEVNIEDCVAGACQNNATCIDGINRFTCMCARGFEGTNCEKNIDECARYLPCQHGATCTDLVADYSCTCVEFSPSVPAYGGKNCSVRLTGCDTGHNCQNGQCVPKLLNESTLLHGYLCRCQPGFRGQFCQESTTVTFSSNGSLIRYSTTQDDSGLLSFRFRTTLTNAVLVVFSYSPTTFVSVEISLGQLVVVYHDAVSNFTDIVDSQEHVSNAKWHQASLDLHSNVSLTLVSAACGREQCNTQFSFPRGKPSFSTRTVYFGNMGSILLQQTHTQHMFVGCLEDIMCGDIPLYTGQQQGYYENMTRSCPRSIQCQAYTCNRQGTCEDLWDTFLCHCLRPYWGNLCQKEYTKATFSKNGFPSLAVFRLDSVVATFSRGLDLSLFLQTRQREGIIMYLTNNDSSLNMSAFMTLELRGGCLAARLSLCSEHHYFISRDPCALDPGSLNFVHTTLQDGLLLLSVNKSIFINETVPVGMCLFQPTVAYFGNVPEISGQRQRRQAVSAPPPVSQLQPYNGIIIDIQMQGRTLDFEVRNGADNSSFLPLSSSENITQGAVSTVSVCNTSTPCANGGTCNDVFFNDFECDCPEGYLGKNCSQPDFCKANSCPNHTHCQSLQQGFECISVASFNGVSSLATYTAHLPGRLPSQQISLMLRTRSLQGAIMEVRALSQQNNFIKLRVRDGVMEVNYQLKSQGFSSSLRMGHAVNDGQWYSLHVDLTNNTVSVRLSQNGTIVEEGRPQPIQDAVEDLNSLVLNGSIQVGDVADSKEQPFKGCLQDVRLGGILLPFVSDSYMNNNNASVKFSATNLNLELGCEPSDACQSALCTSHGRCTDVWNDYMCDCDQGFKGRFCESQVDPCAEQGGCENEGLCLAGLAPLTCICPPGFTGTRCETPFDACANNSCANGSACIVNPNVTRGYVCNCSNPRYSGDLCNISIMNKSCADNLCLNKANCTSSQTGSGFTCACTPGYTGVLCESAINYCVDLPCNNGTCISVPGRQNYTCQCSPGFTGGVCEINIDNCTLNPCHNGGKCVDGINQFTCVCNSGWTGPTCDVNINECNQSVCQHGSCTDLAPEYFCNCTNTGYTGQNCSVELDECKHNFCVSETSTNCTNKEGDYQCDCREGYNGPNCSTAFCDTSRCINGGQCNITSAPWGTQWQCQCLHFYGGPVCEKAGPCTSNPCNITNTVKCQQDMDVFNLTDPSSGNFTCLCHDGWEGGMCSKDVDECAIPNKCQHGGTCVNQPGSFLCRCTVGYTGKNCEVDIDECEPKPCLNNGSCTQGIGNFSCNCTDTGYEGDLCSQDVDECQTPSLCQNNISCSNFPGSFTCHCGAQYLGNRCEYLNPCFSMQCQNGGQCNHTYSATEDSYLPSCSCISGYQGAQCQTSPSKDVDLGVIIGPIVAGVLLIIIIGVIIFIMVARKKRATHGAYSPSRQETAGARVELGNVLKKPPEERLI